MGYWDNFSNNIVQMANTLLPVAQKATPKVLAGDPSAFVALGQKETYKPSVSKTMVSPIYEKEEVVSELENEENKMPSAADVLAIMRAANNNDVWSRKTTTTTPYAREDMLARRALLGDATAALDDAMKIRESTGYSLANALSKIPQQQGYGTWITDFARAFGGGMSGAYDRAVDRAKTRAENDIRDIKLALDFDKALGDTVVSSEYGSPKNSYMDMLALSLLNGGTTNE